MSKEIGKSQVWAEVKCKGYFCNKDDLHRSVLFQLFCHAQVALLLSDVSDLTASLDQI